MLSLNLCRRAAAIALCGAIAASSAAPALAAQAAEKEKPIRIVSTLPETHVESGGPSCNAPSDGGWRNASEEELLSFLNKLARMTRYDSSRASRYLNYYGSRRYTPDQILRIVNTDNDLPVYENMNAADLSRGVLVLVNKYNDLGHYSPDDLASLGSYGSWGELRREARDAFVTMVDAAAKDGCRIWAVSPYRSYERQRSIYSSYVYSRGRAQADTYSARAGSSEHQTGLAVDVAVRGYGYNSFGGTKESAWMQAHAHEYGFILRYGEGMKYLTGYIYEPWHYRYVGREAAARIVAEKLTFEEYYAYYVVAPQSAAPTWIFPDAQATKKSTYDV